MENEGGISEEYVGRVIYPEIDTSSEMGFSEEIMVQANKDMIVDDKIFVAVNETMYVAVSNEIKENRSLLTWSLQNSGGKKVCIIHVYQPAKKIPTPLGNMLASTLGEKEVGSFREKEKAEMTAVLDEYLSIAEKSGVSIEKLYIEADSIEKGIIQLVEQHNIGKLVIGAAANKHYSRKMTEVRSQKAIYVRDNAPPFCHIWFICNGYLIHTRKAIKLPGLSSAGENAPETRERSEATAPFLDSYDVSPPRWSTGSIDGAVSMSGTAREFAAGRPSMPSSPMNPHFMFRNEPADKATGLESLYIEECMRRREAETELAIVREELEWMKTHVAELPNKNEELQKNELDKAKAELEHVKNNVLGQLRMAVEQKALLESQIRNATFLLEMLGEKLASAINVVHKYDQV